MVPVVIVIALQKLSNFVRCQFHGFLTFEQSFLSFSILHKVIFYKFCLVVSGSALKRGLFFPGINCLFKCNRTVGEGILLIGQKRSSDQRSGKQR